MATTRYLPAVVPQYLPSVPTASEVRSQAVKVYRDNSTLFALLAVLLALGIIYYFKDSIIGVFTPASSNKQQQQSNIVITPKPTQKPKPKPATTETATSSSKPASRVIARFGDKGKYYVRQVQEALNKLGENLEPDGDFGTKTMQALARKGFKNPKQVTDTGLAALRRQKKITDAGTQAVKIAATTSSPLWADAYLWWKSVTA